MNERQRRAKEKKDDEFYTPLDCIETEIRYYEDQLKGKVIYCNCDSPESNFVRYFKDNFARLGLKRLIATCYDYNYHPLFSDSSNALHYEYDGVTETIVKLNGSGSYDSPECLRLLQECDVVITNPPFSLMKYYIPTIINSGKKFLIVTSFDGICNNFITRPMMKNLIWPSYGVNFGVDYLRPDGTTKSVGTAWVTNLNRTFSTITPTATYDPEIYPKYIESDIDAINVDTIKDIPGDYEGIIGVPVSFMKYWNPDEWELFGNSFYYNDHPNGGGLHYNKIVRGCPQPVVETVTPYRRVLIRRRRPEEINK